LLISFRMRVAACCLLSICAARGQFRSTVPLVVAPTTITDAKGRFVDGLDVSNLILYDNNVPQTIHLDWMTFPISLVVAVQTSDNSGPVLDKLRGSGILFTQLLAGDAGETAVISFSDAVTVHQDFTSDPDKVIGSLRKLRIEGGIAPELDAIHKALEMLSRCQPGRRHIVFMIAENRDRNSQAELPAIMEEVQRQNATVYWLTYSPFAQPFTGKQKMTLDPGSKRWQNPDKAKAPSYSDKVEEKRRLEKEGQLQPADVGPGGYLYALKELFRMNKPDLAELFTKTTGGTTDYFLKQNALENAIQAIGKEVHRQYILSFEPKSPEPGKFHEIRVEVIGHPELRVKTRAGYWGVQ
jgi:VWFA-related protein